MWRRFGLRQIFIFSLGHDKPFLYEPRGFSNIYDHDKAIIENWNSVVDMDDDVYLLGDVMLGDNTYGLSCLKQLKGRIHIVCGNHDSPARKELYAACWNVVEVCDGKFFHFGKKHFYLSHFPCITTNYDDGKGTWRRTWNLCGHAHTQDPFLHFNTGAFHVEQDTNQCYPWSIEDIIAAIQKKVEGKR